MKRSYIKRSKKPLRKRRKKTARQLLFKKAEKAVKDFIKERDGKCVAQGEGGKMCGGYLQASHIKNVGRYKGMELDPKNILSMCYTHHIHWWHKDPIDAARWLKVYLSKDWYKYIEEKSRVITPVPTEEELQDIIAKYSNKT